MNVSDLIAQFADFLSKIEHPENTSPNQAELTQVEVDRPGDQEESPTMIPPLQQKLELLKKSVGVDSAFDHDPDSSTAEPETTVADDELNRIKQIAGIGLPTAVVHIAGEDSDIE